MAILTGDVEPSNGYHKQQIRDSYPSSPPLPRFRRAGREGKSQSYLFVTGEGHDEDMTSRGDIGSIPLDTYRERAHKRRKKPSQSGSKPRGTRTMRQSEKGERMCRGP
jgi:hypothetical protein